MAGYLGNRVHAVYREDSMLRAVALLTSIILTLTLAAPAARAQGAPAKAADPQPSAMPDALPRPDPSAIRECGVRVRKAGISLFGLGALIGITGAALVADGAFHPDSKIERNAGYATLAVGVAVAIPGLYLWIRGQKTINDVERELGSAAKVSAITPIPYRGGGGMGYVKTF